jgi:hypothetical protein
VLFFDAQKGKGTIYFRSYFDGRRKFDKAVNICEDGKEQIIMKRKVGITCSIDKNEITIKIPLRSIEEYFDSEIIETMKISELCYTDEIFSIKSLTEKEIEKREKKAYKEYLELEIYQISSFNLTSAYLVARKLFEDIKNNNFGACNHTFIYPIHQYLSEMIRKSDERRVDIQNILINWLKDKENVPPTVRDFAAFELGMSKAENAVDALLERVKDENELLPVRNYSAMALGMIMERNDDRVYDLLNISFKETNEEIKKSIINSFLFITKYKEEN